MLQKKGKKEIQLQLVKNRPHFLLNLHSNIFCYIQLIMYYLIGDRQRRNETTQPNSVLVSEKQDQHSKHYLPRLILTLVPQLCQLNNLGVHTEIAKGNEKGKATHISCARGLVFISSFRPRNGSLQKYLFIILILQMK